MRGGQHEKQADSEPLPSQPAMGETTSAAAVSPVIDVKVGAISKATTCRLCVIAVSKLVRLKIQPMHLFLSLLLSPGWNSGG